MKEFKSPLQGWEGGFSLPDPNDFSGTHWRTWTDSVNKPLRSSYATTHLFGYAGLELIAKHGRWDLEIPIKQVQAWEMSPDDERVKLIAWVGAEVKRYITGIIDPKE